jgi:hypothetical protein
VSNKKEERQNAGKLDRKRKKGREKARKKEKSKKEGT